MGRTRKYTNSMKTKSSYEASQLKIGGNNGKRGKRPFLTLSEARTGLSPLVQVHTPPPSLVTTPVPDLSLPHSGVMTMEGGVSLVSFRKVKEESKNSGSSRGSQKKGTLGC